MITPFMVMRMSAEISCPQCGLPVNSQSLSCEHCGVDLALAAVLVERDMIASTSLPNGVPIVPELLIPRMGDFLLESKVITRQQLQQALDYQAEKTGAGNPILLGQALMELGLIDRQRLDQVITMQILQLQNALKDANRQLERRVQERTRDLQQALQRLGELNQLKSNFIANISHELRTPLTHLKGYLELMADGGLGTMSSSQSDAVAVMQRAESRLERLIEDLIQFSLVLRGDLNIEIKTVELDHLIRQALEDLRPKAAAGQLALGVKIPRQLPPICVDGEKITWVIAQLVDNAIKFTPRGGRVRVEVAVEMGLVTLSVSDTGIGIPAERLNELFEPFHQLDSSASRRYGGTGLGLAMVRRILDAHGVQIRVQSVEGKGSRFEFSLPIQEAPADQAKLADLDGR